MAISGSPSANEINVELNRSGTAAWSMNGTEERALAGRPGSGTAISMNDFKGKSASIVGTIIMSQSTNDGTISDSRYVKPGLNGRMIVDIVATSSWNPYISQVYSSNKKNCSFHIGLIDDPGTGNEDAYYVYSQSTSGSNLDTVTITPFSFYIAASDSEFHTTWYPGSYYFKIGQTNTEAYYGLTNSKVNYKVSLG